MMMRISAVVLVFVIFTVTRSEGIKCYTCNSATDGKDCGDYFAKESAKESKHCAQCLKSNTEASGQKVVFRSCLQVDTGLSGCKNEDANGTATEKCYCKSDLCNTSSHVTVTVATCLAAGALLLLFKNIL